MLTAGAFLILAMLLGGVALAQPAAPMFQDCAQCPVMMSLPPGSVLMGSTKAETDREPVPNMGANDIAAWERPQHRVDIAYRFAIGKFEITRAEFAAFVEATGYRPEPGCRDSAGRFDAEASWQAPGFPQTARDPVVCVNWADIAAYAGWLSVETGAAYRLPSETEWEYAARAGTETARPWGDGTAAACDHANAADQSFANAYVGQTFVDRYLAAGGTLPDGLPAVVPCDDGYAETAPVGSFQPNAFGLHDMLGNVWEWVADCARFSYHIGPRDGSAWQDPESCAAIPNGFSQAVRMFRGGAFSYPPFGLRSARRGIAEIDRRTWNRGFRLVRSLD